MPNNIPERAPRGKPFQLPRSPPPHQPPPHEQQPNFPQSLPVFSVHIFLSKTSKLHPLTRHRASGVRRPRSPAPNAAQTQASRKPPIFWSLTSPGWCAINMPSLKANSHQAAAHNCPAFSLSLFIRQAEILPIYTRMVREIEKYEPNELFYGFNRAAAPRHR